MASPPQVDSVLPRVKAVFHALIPAASYLAGPPSAPWILGFTCIAMSLSVLLGPKFSLFGRLARAIRSYLKLAPGRQESLAPHRFAEAVGAIFLGAAAAAYGTGLLGVGAALALVVVALAVLNAAAGICVGCQFYILAQRLRPASTRAGVQIP